MTEVQDYEIIPLDENVKNESEIKIEPGIGISVKESRYIFSP